MQVLKLLEQLTCLDICTKLFYKVDFSSQFASDSTSDLLGCTGLSDLGL